MKKNIFSIIALSIFFSSQLFSQSKRVRFVDLINRASIQTIFTDDVFLPTETGSTSYVTIFKFYNSIFPYKKISGDILSRAPEAAELYATMRLSKEVFYGLSKEKNTEIEVVERDIWNDTLYTISTKTDNLEKKYTSGSLVTELNSGSYHSVLQLSFMENTNEQIFKPKDIKIINWSNKMEGEIYFITAEHSDSALLYFTNLGDNILYGEDFRTLIRIPTFSTDATYEIKINTISISRKDTLKGKEVFTYTIDKDDLIVGKLPKFNKNGAPSLQMIDSKSNLTYALVPIPHSTFENATYEIAVTHQQSDKPIAKKTFQSYWADMPASLYNLDIAIKHLKFFLKKEDLKKINSGTKQEKEQKFRAFWKRLDPTPNTVFNERMDEYYRRIDYAFKEYGNKGNIDGHESDQGKVYINYGSPDSIDRKFPTNSEVIEIWKYGTRRFVFKANSGFGDFELIGTE